jgi:hypothetical protein
VGQAGPHHLNGPERPLLNVVPLETRTTACSVDIVKKSLLCFRGMKRHPAGECLGNATIDDSQKKIRPPNSSCRIYGKPALSTEVSTLVISPVVDWEQSMHRASEASGTPRGT